MTNFADFGFQIGDNSSTLVFMIVIIHGKKALGTYISLYREENCEEKGDKSDLSNAKKRFWCKLRTKAILHLNSEIVKMSV